MRSPERRTTRTLSVVLAAVSLVAAAACGSDADESTDESVSTEMDMNDEVHTDPDMEDDENLIGDPMDEGFLDQDDEDADVTSESGAAEMPGEDGDDEAGDPERIVSLSPTATETLFALGADEALVAVDSNSNFPAEALDLPNELSAFDPSVEAIAEFEPDLVLIGGDFTGLGDQLTALGIEFLDMPPAASIEDAYSQIEQLGATTGHDAEAAELVGQMQSDIDSIVDRVGGAGAGLSFYHEISSDLFTADSSTFIGEIYSLLEMVNIADADTSESFGFPQLNAEFVVEQNPDLIFIPTGTFAFTTADDVIARPGWDAITAVQTGNIFETDDEIGGRWGPRIVDVLDEIAVAIENVDVSALAES